jgi:endonuclease/exonuclease/phosphatase family metal-dependent hydrolase
MDPRLEGHSRAGRGSLEYERDRTARERIRAERVVLELACPREQILELRWLELLAGQEVARQAQQCTLATLMRLRVVTWNLMHGRAQPPAGHELRDEFCAALASWEWDVALLQEVPPWWPGPIAAALHSEYRLVMTSRNGLLSLRRALAVRWPDLIKSNGGGCNVILAHRDRIVAHRSRRLRRFPERRSMHAVRLACGVWVANVHASTAESAAAPDCRLTVKTAVEWAAGEPLVVGGDFNLREPSFDGLTHVCGRDVDHIFANAGLRGTGECAVLDRGRLSDHPPLAATVLLP